MKKIILFAIILVAVIVGCRKEPLQQQAPEFDRNAMLKNWADNIIIPVHTAYNTSTITLHTDTEAFLDDPTLANLEMVRTSWFESYKAWQNVPFLTNHITEKQCEAGVLINLYTNRYPTKSSSIDIFVENGGYDFTISSNSAIQGFPALDYMLYGLADTDDAILSFYTTNGNAEKYKQYLIDLTARIKAMSTLIYDEWINGYRDEFVANDGNNIESSVNRIVNDFMYSYEFDIRTSKIGYPSGACIGCDGVIRKEYIEAPYRGDISKILLLEALDAAQDFYNGVPFKGAFEERGTSLYHYLDFLDAQKDGEKLGDLINTQFDKSRASIKMLSDDFASEIENRNSTMVDVHTELQLNVALLKINMMYAMRIAQDYSSDSCGGD